MKDSDTRIWHWNQNYRQLCSAMWLSQRAASVLHHWPIFLAPTFWTHGTVFLTLATNDVKYLQNLFSFKNLFYMYGVLPICMCVVFEEARRVCWIPKNSSYGCFEPLYGCWKSNLGPLEEYPVSVLSEPDHQPGLSSYIIPWQLISSLGKPIKFFFN